jgi:uncharacterized protein (UPF0332 family)
METWRQLSEDSLSAAKTLLREGNYRSSVSRSYYAAYYAATNEITRSLTTFPDGWNNPPHEKVPLYIQNNLAMSPVSKKTIKRILGVLRQFRVDADYRPYRLIDAQIARNCIRDAGRIQQEFWWRG